MPFNDNMFRPCPMLENPEYIEKMVRETEAPSTDMQSPESVEHLVSKTKDYAEKWAPKAEEMWTERQKEKSARVYKQEVLSLQGSISDYGRMSDRQQVFNKLAANKEIIQEYTHPYRELMAYYRCAMMEVSTKFQVLNEELSLQYDRNPIETVKTRLKSLESIVEKLQRKHLPLTLEAVEQEINDVAGVRVICSYPSDIITLSEAFLKQDDIQLITRKDYILTPKPNGYRSLHLIISIPIFLHDQKRHMHVEVQFRTISMDWWASLEHKIRYKKDLPLPDALEKELLECANISEELDQRMENLQIIADSMAKNTG